MSTVTIDGKIVEANVVITTQNQPPIPPPVCPTGYHWDGTKCVPDVTPPPVQGIEIKKGDNFFFTLSPYEVKTYYFNDAPGVIPDGGFSKVRIYDDTIAGSGICELTYPDGKVIVQPLSYGSAAGLTILSSMPKGVYYFKMTETEGALSTFKLVVM